MPPAVVDAVGTAVHGVWHALHLRGAVRGAGMACWHAPWAVVGPGTRGDRPRNPECGASGAVWQSVVSQ